VRAVAFLLVVMVGPVAADGTDWPTERVKLGDLDADAPDPPALSPFASRTAFYLMRLGDDGSPRCEEWATRPGSANHGQLTHDTLAVDYHSAGIRLDACDYHALVHEEANGNELDVDGARWFRNPRACQTALAGHRRVATDFHTCLAKPPTPKAIEAARARADLVFRHGGTLWLRDDGSCSAVAVTFDDRRTPRGQIAFGSDSLISYDLDDQGKLVDEEGDDESPSFGDGTITVFRMTLNPAESCRAAVALDRRRASWMPTPP
jgi:hypothetical protein